MIMPKCIGERDCFAHKAGKCTALSDTNFKDGNCPFYKSDPDRSLKRKIENDIANYCKESLDVD